MPKPRRKKWWELLEDSKYDKYYEDAKVLLKVAPPQLKETINFVIKGNHMDVVLRL